MWIKSKRPDYNEVHLRGELLTFCRTHEYKKEREREIKHIHVFHYIKKTIINDVNKRTQKTTINDSSNLSRVTDCDTVEDTGVIDEISNKRKRWLKMWYVLCNFQ